MLDIVTNSDFAPFSVAIGIVFALAAIEIVGVLAGLSASSVLDSVMPDIELDVEPGSVEADAVAGSFLQNGLAWLCVGRVPALIVLIVLLTSFGVVGTTVQLFALEGFGSTLPAAIVAAPAFFAALPMTRGGALAIARILPKEYSEAASQSEFIGRTATIIRGIAKRNAPAEAKVKGPFGKTHYILLEPDAEDEEFGQGANAVIVSQTGVVYRGVSNFNSFVADETGLRK